MQENIDIPKDFHDYAFCTLFGKYQSQMGIAGDLHLLSRLTIDFSKTEWASPLAMLGCFCLIKEYYIQINTIQNINVEINLGISDKNPVKTQEINHNIFLKFFLNQGFFEISKEFCTFKLNGLEYKGDDRFASLKYDLYKFTASSPEVFKSADFIKAQLVPIQEHFTDGKLSEKSLQKITEKLMDEAGTRVIDSFYTSYPHLRDHYFQKLRIVIREIIANAIEHAYPKNRNKCGQIGFYARLRTMKILDQNVSKQVTKTLENKIKSEKNEDNYPTLRNFNHPDLNDWIEFFVCDVGIGLTDSTNLNAWKSSIVYASKEGESTADTFKIIEILDKAQGIDARNPLRLLKEKLFSFDFSRLNPQQRRDEVRSQMTGLRHVGLTLTKENDFLRIYANGEWVGADHPWKPNDTGNHKRLSKFEGYEAVKGTMIHVCMPNKYKIEYPESWRTCERNPLINETLVNALGTKQYLKVVGKTHKERIHSLQQSINEYYPDVCFINKRGTDIPISVDLERIKNPNSKLSENGFRHVIIRVARSMSKNELYRCMDFFIGTPRDGNSFSPGKASIEIDTLVFADLSPFQGLVFENIITDILRRRSQTIRPNIVLQTEDWAFFKLCCTPEICHFECCNFFEVNNKTFGIVQLLNVLRLDDSLTFWAEKRLDDFLRSKPEDIKIVDQCFLLQEIRWGEKNIVGYLDLPQALADHPRFEAVRRALQRALSLYKTYRPEAADSLVGALITEVDKRIQYSQLLDDSLSKPLMVGSILVTGNTVENLERKSVPYIHLFVHPDCNKIKSGGSPRALDWLPVGQSTVQLVDPQRIRETPFIGSRGDYGIGLDRGGSETYQQPDIAYQVWRQLKVLKIGHWVYEGHHDLLTINPFRAFDLSSLDGDTDPYRWLNAQLKEELSKKENKGAVLVYPSHPSVDLMIDKMGLDKNRIFPIKFIGHSTVSPFRASPLGLERLTSEITELKKVSNTVTAVIFDDATRTGKMMNELSQIVRHAGADNVRTISLVDRSGLPAYGSLLTNHLREHPRLWRWDMPKLGHDRDCPLCSSLSKLHNMHSDFVVTSLKDRISELEKIWRPRRLIEDWATAKELTHKLINPMTLSFQDFSKPRAVPSGIYDQMELFPRANDSANAEGGRLPVDHTSAISYSAMCLEIARLSTRADLPLTKQKKHFKDDPNTSLILLSSQLFLFYDELTSKQRFERMKKLIELLLHKSCTHTPWSGLAVLVLSMSDDSLARKLWDEFQKSIWPNFEKQEKSTSDLYKLKINWVESPDLFLSMHLIRKIGFESGIYETLPKDETKNKSSFLLRLDGVDRNKDGVRKNIEKLLHYVGITDNKSHMAVFHQAITDFKSTNSDVDEESHSKLKNKVIRMTKDIVVLIDSLINNYLFFGDSDEIKDYLRSVKDAILASVNDSNIDKLQEIFFGDSDNAFSKYLRRSFLVSAGLGLPQDGVASYILCLGNKINFIIRETQDNWGLYFADMVERINNNPTERDALIHNWSGITRPRINRVNQSEFTPTSSHYLLWTPSIMEYLSELFRNCIWRTEPIIEDCGTHNDLEYEWEKCNSPDEIQTKKGIRLRLMNICDNKNEYLNLKDSLFKGDAERMGLIISCNIVPYKKSNLVQVDVFFPYFNSDQ